MKYVLQHVVVLLLLVAVADEVRADDPLARAEAVHEAGNALVDAGLAMKNRSRLREGLGKLREAQSLYQEHAAAKYPPMTAGMQARLDRLLEQVDKDLAFVKKAIQMDAGATEVPEDPPTRPETQPGPADAHPPAGGAAQPEPEIHVPPPTEGEPLGDWCRGVIKTYEATDSPAGKAALLRQLAKFGGVLALPHLMSLFEKEDEATVRDGIHEALTLIGTQRVANLMASYASRTKEGHWGRALDVIYRCLEKAEAQEPERPFQGAIRAFHQIKERKLTLGIIERLDAMGYEGTAALGEVLFVEDIGYHDHVIGLLSGKQDRRAVPPLVHKMNRFKFDYHIQIPAHEALLKLGWYAVPELVDRLDDKAAGIWISWTLRKITGETMGTDKRKWHDWWKSEKVRHPELFDDPAERPGRDPAPVTPGGG